MLRTLMASCVRLAIKLKNKTWKKVRPTKKVFHIGEEAKATVCTGVWLGEQAKSYESKFLRKGMETITTNLSVSKTYSLKSMANDYWIETTLQSGKYTWNDMLVIRNPFGEAPLTALALFVTEQECAVRVTVKGKTEKTDYVSVIPQAKYHRIPILGLYAGYENTVIIELLDKEEKAVSTRAIPIKTQELPKGLQEKIRPVKVSDNPAFENIMISGGVNIRTCVFDREGEIRYYLRRPGKGYGIFPLAKGHFFYMEREVSTPSYANPQSVIGYDMDYLGRTYKTYVSRNGFHHTLEEKEPGGNFLVGSNSMKEHTEDMVVEIDRNTGEIVWSLCMDEIFDEHYQNRMDWAHVNSAAYYKETNEVILSLRNIHTVCSVDYTTKKLRWMLSDPDFWKETTMTDKILKPVGDVPWVYQQHSAFYLQEDLDGNLNTKHLIVFDNHWAKRRPAKSFDKAPLSYVSFYNINEKESTVSLHKRFSMPKTPIRSIGFYLEKAGRVYAMCGSFEKPIEGCQGGVYEYDYETGEVLSQFLIEPGCFRAYNFEPDIGELVKPLNCDREYIRGELREPELVSQKEAEKLHFRKSHGIQSYTVECAMQENILLVRGVSHAIRKVYLVGSNGTYAYDFTDTYQTYPEVFGNAQFYRAMWVKNIPSDKYQIYIDVDGDMQYTRKYISI